MPYKLVTLNVDSIVHSSRRTLLSDFISSSGADILFLQETKIDGGMKVNFSGYNVFRCDVRRGWGGSAILVRDSIPVRGAFCIREPCHIAFVECRIDAEWIRFASCYVPHGIGDPRSVFENLFRGHPATIFGGDFNSRSPVFGDSVCNCYGLALCDAARALDVHVVSPPVPTCYRAAEGSFTDKFLICGMTPIFSSPTVLTSFSDHCAFSITLPGSPPTSVPAEGRRMFHFTLPSLDESEGSESFCAQ